jgi:hypothetical protein
MREHLIISDVQTKPGVPMEHLDWIGRYIVDKKPDVIIQIGDFADMPSLSSYDKGKKSFEGRRYKADIEASIEAMTRLLAPLNAHNEHKAKLKEKQYKPRMVLTLGNHEDRIRRAAEDEAQWDGLISVDDLKYKEFGWEVYPFLQPVNVDGILYCHYFQSGVMGRAVTSARALVKAKHCSAVMGHVQTTDIYMGDTRADGKPILGLFAGVTYLHDEAFLGQANSCRRQIVVLHEVEDGCADPMFVSLSYLQRKYGTKAA